jgi:LytS/YehU family sensor histidine kinase
VELPGRPHEELAIGISSAWREDPLVSGLRVFLVENAIIWGVSRQCGEQLIAIRSSRDNGTLWLEVDDSGPGFDGSSHAPSDKGIGLTNTEARLEQLYGAAHHIEYGRSAWGGASVAIQIPFE